MKHRYSIFYCLLIIFTLTNLFPASAAQGDSSHIKGAYPQTIAKAALLMDASSGRVLYAVNARQQMSPASVTKIMTGLIIAEKGDLNREVTISQAAADTPENSVWLEAGEKLTREQLLYACMLHSANDAAVALAESAAGSEKNFVELMNRRAGQLGMKDTHFDNPHGLETKTHYTSAYDLALVSREALNNGAFRKVVATKTKTIPWPDRDYDRLLINQNRLLYRYENALGIKTGYTKQAGNCVVGAAQKGSLLLIAVALNSSSVYQDLEQMLDYGFAHYHKETVKTRQELSVMVPVVNGQVKSVKAQPETDLTVAVTAKEQSRLSYKVYPRQQAEAPVKKGQVLGSCVMYLNGCEVGKVDLLAAAPVAPKPPFFTRFKSVCITVLKIFVKAVLIIFGCLYLIRFVNLRRRRRRKW